MRRGREFYSENYEKVMELHKKGMNVKEIASQLGMSYSAVYHWVRGLRKPDIGNINEFIEFLRSNGPTPVLKLQNFPKHNELFLTASRRGLPVKRLVLGRKFREYSTWYLLDNQEELLKKRIEELFSRIKEFKDELRRVLNGI
jgi:transcriptional regulator with XRE-family HTH domain